MAETTVRTGSCLCGAVSFTANNGANKVAACHCKSCRKWGGSAFMEVDCGPDVEFEGSDKLSIYSSSDWAERAFCSVCGSHMFYRLKDSGAHMMLVGLFDDDSDLKFERQVFIDAKPHYYEFANSTQNVTGEELFAQFAPPEE